MKLTSRAGFTLTEVLIVIAIISILAAVATLNFNDARAEARDAKRKSDLQTISAALELYKQKWGRYPEGCRAPNSWSGEPGTTHACVGDDPRYIMGNPGEGRPFVPDFMPVLPRDPRLNGNDSGYVYSINPGNLGYHVPEGMVFKLLALNTVETELVDYTHTFTRCGARNINNTVTLGAHECSSVPSAPAGGSPSIASICSGGQVANNANDYAVMGGFSDGQTPQSREYYSDIIRCK